MSIRLKLCNLKQKSQQRRHRDIAKLKCTKTNKQFVVELRNRFAALANSTNDPGINIVWGKIKNTYIETATTILGYRKKENKECLTAVTWEKIEERKHLEAKMLSIKSPRLQQQAKQAYKAKDREVKKSARRDRRLGMHNIYRTDKLSTYMGEN